MALYVNVARANSNKGSLRPLIYFAPNYDRQDQRAILAPDHYLWVEFQLWLTRCLDYEPSEDEVVFYRGGKPNTVEIGSQAGFQQLLKDLTISPTICRNGTIYFTIQPRKLPQPRVPDGCEETHVSGRNSIGLHTHAEG